MLRQAKNLPKTISDSEMGFVNRLSSVPVCISSEKLRMLNAGITNRKRKGATEKVGPKRHN